jgi:trehalose utilization protein
MIRVTVWNEYRHEKEEPQIAAIYPDGIHSAIAKYLNTCPGIAAGTATLDEPEHGLTDGVLENTDVLLWWGHIAHGEVRDEVVEKVFRRVMRGMGLIVLHSGHHSKIFRRLMGTTCNLSWRDIGEKERIWVIEPGHPIAQGLGGSFELPHEEMYGERFDIPEPDTLVMLGWFRGGEVIRAGCCYNRGYGKVFYFQPGHEMYPNYYNANVQTVLRNAVRWACPETTAGMLDCPQIVVPPEGLF